MGTRSTYPQRVPKPSFTPDEQQAKMLAALKRAHAKVAAADAEYKRLLAECADAGIPILTLAKTVGAERKTVYRHLGRSMT